MLKHSLQKNVRPVTLLRMFAVLGLVTATLIWLASLRHDQGSNVRRSEFSSQAKAGVFYPTAEQWATLTIEPVQRQVFRSERITEGKIAVDEDRSTPIFSPYAGRVLKLFVKPGDTVAVGQPLFTVQATDMVQAQNDFISAATGLNKARSAQSAGETVRAAAGFLLRRLAFACITGALREAEYARRCIELVYVVHFCLSQRGIIGIDCS